MAYRVLIVDDQKMQRKALEAFLKESELFEVVETLGSAELAVTFCQNTKIDLILMDVVMVNGMGGIEAAARIKKQNPKVKVILVTSMPEVSYLKRAKDAGVDSLWYKEYEEQPILEVMRRTMEGESIYPNTTPEILLGNASSVELTEREIDVLRKVITGATDQEIAEALHISMWTARSHLQHILQKTGYKNRVELAVKARIAGVVIDE